MPVPKLTVSAGDLPAGLTLTDNRDGTATIVGTPTAGGGSDRGVRDGHERCRKHRLHPHHRGAGHAGLHQPGGRAPCVGRVGSFTVTTSGIPTPTIVVDAGLPAWLAFDDFGDGTGVLRTAGPAPDGRLLWWGCAR